MLTVLCYPKCSTCAKATQWLQAHSIPFTYRDIQQRNPTAAELGQWYRRSGLPLGRFWNTSGLAYRTLDISKRRTSMPEAAQLELLATDGMLVKRPLVVGDDFVLTGFNEAQWAEHLL